MTFKIGSIDYNFRGTRNYRTRKRTRTPLNTKTKRELSLIQKRLRRKGYSQKTAFKKAGKIKGVRWKNKQKHAYKDYDGDGVVNKYDCQPNNPFRQDMISDTIERRKIKVKDRIEKYKRAIQLLIEEGEERTRNYGGNDFIAQIAKRVKETGRLNNKDKLTLSRRFAYMRNLVKQGYKIREAREISAMMIKKENETHKEDILRKRDEYYKEMIKSGIKPDVALKEAINRVSKLKRSNVEVLERRDKYRNLLIREGVEPRQATKKADELVLGEENIRIHKKIEEIKNKRPLIERLTKRRTRNIDTRLRGEIDSMKLI